jgi:N-acetylglutamate synthase-like GNAT family acetyltransferase
VSELVFRRAGEHDAETVRALTHAAYAKWVPVIGRRPKPMNADYEHAVQAHVIELAYLDGELAGLIELIPAADHLLLENLAVAPAHQHKGLGRRLIARVEATARARGLPMVRLYTNKAFTTNLAFYQKLGYTLEREEPIKSGGFLVHFVKAMKGPSAA